MAATAVGMNSAPAPFRPLENQIQEFRNIVVRQMDPLHVIALRHLCDHADAEDAVQDALLSPHAHLDQFKGQTQMSTWLTTIVINAARMKLRQRSRNVHSHWTSRLQKHSHRCGKCFHMLIQTQRSYVEDLNLQRG
jgi:DNA-directed RNA polymerase specialized sigma24 family protein